MPAFTPEDSRSNMQRGPNYARHESTQLAFPDSHAMQPGFGLGSPRSPKAVHLPNDKVLKLIKQRYPRTVLATAWYSRKDLKNNWQISDKPHPEALLLDSWAIVL